MVSIFVRTFIVYVLLSISMKVMGKRQIGELDVGELVCTLLISEIAAIPIDDPDLPLLNAVIPITFILSLEIVFSYAKTRSNSIKKIMEGRAAYLVYQGKIDQKALCESRITVNEVLSEMRTQGIGRIEDIDYAILEQSGKISILKKGDSTMAHPLVIDGEYMSDELARVGLERAAVEEALDKEGLRAKEIFLLTATDDGHINIIKRMEK